MSRILAVLTAALAVSGLGAATASASAVPGYAVIGINGPDSSNYNPNSFIFQVQFDCATGAFSGSGFTDFSSRSFPGYTISGVSQSNGDLTFTARNQANEVALQGSGSWADEPFPAVFGTTTGSLVRGDTAAFWAVAGANAGCRRFPAVTTADQCKGNGWKNVSSADDIAFKNQGDCVSYVTTKGKNAPAGS